MVAQGGEVPAEAREGGSAVWAAEAPGDLLLDLQHAQVALGLVVVERHPQIADEGEHGVAVGGQPIQQVLRLGLLPPAPLPPPGGGGGRVRWWRQGGIGGATLLQADGAAAA